MPKQSLDLTALKRNLGPRVRPASASDAITESSVESSHDTIPDTMAGGIAETDPGTDSRHPQGRLPMVLKKKEKRYIVPFTLRIEAGQNERLDKLVHWSGMSKNELITTIIDAALPELEAQAKG